jgi:hypothetical protein
LCGGRDDEEKYGEYRTKRLVLEKYDALTGRLCRGALRCVQEDLTPWRIKG